jgi:hypothetical protein
MRHGRGSTKRFRKFISKAATIGAILPWHAVMDKIAGSK